MNDVQKDRSKNSEPLTRHREAGSPVVVDLGRQRRKHVNELREGKQGKLLAEITEAIDALRAQNAIAADAQPVIVVVREKRKTPNLFRF